MRFVVLPEDGEIIGISLALRILQVVQNCVFRAVYCLIVDLSAFQWMVSNVWFVSVD